MKTQQEKQARISYIENRLAEMRKAYVHASDGYRLFLKATADLLLGEKTILEASKDDNEQIDIFRTV